MDRLHLRFFDRFLRDIDNGAEADPAVRVFDTGARGWRTPPTRAGGTRQLALHLAAGGALQPDVGAASSEPLGYDPANAPGVAFDVAVVPWEPPLDLRELEGHPDVAVWTTEPLDAALTLRGRSVLELYAATDVDDTDWHVKLADVDAEGRSLRVAWGCLRAACWRSLDEPHPIVPGEVLRYRIELTPAFHTFAGGSPDSRLAGGQRFPVVRAQHEPIRPHRTTERSASRSPHDLPRPEPALGAAAHRRARRRCPAKRSTVKGSSSAGRSPVRIIRASASPAGAARVMPSIE
jgi:uncharacterized protein